MTGTTPQFGHDCVLIGQGLRATVDAGGFEVTAHQWSVTGSTFKQVLYGVSGVNEDNDGIPQEWKATRSIIRLSTADLANPVLEWYFDEGNSIEQVACSFTVRVNGQAIGGGSASRDVDVWVPDYFYGWNSGQVTYDPSNTNPDSLQCQNPSVFPFVGMKFVGSVHVQSFFGGGEWAFAQTCKLHRYQSGFYGYRETTLPDFFLDTSWPYSDVFAVDDGNHETSDSPYVNLVSWANHVEASDDFRMFQSSLPSPAPGNGQGRVGVLARSLLALGRRG